MEMVLNAVNWAEIPVTDFERAKMFYNAIFDFEMPDALVGKNRMGFLLYEFQKAGIGGAIVKGKDYKPSKKGSKVYLNGGTDLNTVLNRVENAGGKIVHTKTLISEQNGYFASFEDTEGNQIYLHSRQ